MLPMLAPPPGPTAPPAASQPASTRPPIINALDYTPKSTISKDDLIAFTVVATDPGGEALQYTWTATKGRLTSNSGSAVAWSPVKADGSLEAGVCTVTVTISNGRQTTSGNLNLQINSNGTVAPGR